MNSLISKPKNQLKIKIKKNFSFFLNELFCSQHATQIPNSWYRFFVNYIRIIFSAFIISLSFSFLLKQIFFNTGASGIAFVVDEITKNNSWVQSHTQHIDFVLYGTLIVVNIPFLIYGFAKFRHLLVFNTIMYIITLSLFGMFLNPVLQNKLHIFNFIKVIHDKYANINGPDKISVDILLFPIIAGVLCALGYSILYNSLATDGGITFLVFAHCSGNNIKSSKNNLKKRNFAYVNIILNLFFFSILTIFLYFFSPAQKAHKDNFLEFISSYRVVGTVMYIIIYSSFTQFLFPFGKRVAITIITKKSFLWNPQKFGSKEQKFLHGITKINECYGMYKQKKCHILICVIPLLELASFRNHALKEDPEAFIFVNKTYQVYSWIKNERFD